MSEAERRFLKSREAGVSDPWFDASPERRAELRVLERLWAELDQMPDLAVLPKRSTHSRRAVLQWGSGAALAAGVAGFALMPRADLATATGERRVAELPDGSGLTMDAYSHMDLRFGAGLREVHLKDGRARFQVARAASPFEVAAGPGRVRLSEGTATVHLWDGEMTVASHEGRCSVTPEGGIGSIELEAGEEVTVGASGAGTPVPISIGQDDWALGRLVFDGQPLRQVVSDLDRYRSGTIVMRGSQLRDLKVTGVFDASRPDVALDAIEASLPVRRRDFGPVTLLTSA